MELLKLMNITKELPDQLLFKFDHLHLNYGERVGIIGRNGSGKSSLLRMINGEDGQYKGHIEMNSTVGYVPQLKEISQESGGEQVRRYLTEVFDEAPDLLLLDEPTANLDLDNIDWLIEQLKQYSGTLLIASHDRYLLNQIIDKIWLVDNRTVIEYVGSYDEVQRIRDKEADKQQRAYDQYQTTVKRLEKEAQKRAEKANKLTKRKKGISTSEWRARSLAGNYDGKAKSLAKTAKTLEKRIEKMNNVEAPKRETDIHLKSVGHLNTDVKTLVNLEAGTIKHNKRLLFNYLPFKISFGEKLAIQGPNQSGKTTFVTRLLNKQLEGYYSDQLSMGYYAQNFIQLDEAETILGNVSVSSQQDIFTIRNLLGALDFKDQEIYKLVDVLSGGERVRVALAKVLLSDNNLLILDEPTNYLDIVTLEALEDFLKAYQGTIIFISHDQAFVQQVAETVYRIENQSLKFPEYQSDYTSNKEQEIQLLELKRDQMMADPEVPLEELKAIVAEIKALTE